MKKLLAPLMLGFGVAMAFIIGRRMSTDAMAVVIGVAVGVAASVPASLLIMALLRRDRQAWQVPPREPVAPPLYPGAPPQAPVIVLSPADLTGQRVTQPQFAPLPPPQWGDDTGLGLRRLRVVGDADDWME